MNGRQSRCVVGTLFSVVMISLGACTANRAYRDANSRAPQAQGSFARGDQLPQHEPYSETQQPLHRFDLSYIEFDEKGDFWDRRQLGWTVNEIQNAAKTDDVVLVVYVHGWQNDASPLAGHDVSKFHCLLEHLAEADACRHRFFGVYVAWRGKSVPGGDSWFPNNSPFDLLSRALFFVPHELSLWGRKNVATHTAGLPTTEAIFQSVEATRHWTQQYGHKSTTILIGHSFGALLLDKALSQALAAKVISENESGGSSFQAPAELVILLNSAAESIYAKEMIDMLRRRAPYLRSGPQEISAQHPLIVSITSKADWATKILFPIGTNISNALGLFRKYEWDTRFGESSHGVSQREYFINTPGHNRHLISHEAAPVSGTPVDPVYEEKDLCAPELLEAFSWNLKHPGVGPNGEIQFKTGVSSSHEVEWQVNPVIPEQLQTPYWIIEVPHEIIRDHSDIFNENAIALMARLFRVSNAQPKQGVITTSGPRTMRLLEPGKKTESTPPSDDVPPR
jgi:pimeloyl-ACP methyl ester carboxylesterase